MVYRPPKKNPATARFPGPQASGDPLSGPLSRAPDGEEIMRGDDRNLVMVDDSYAGGDFEDRVWLFWRRQKMNLLLVVGLACVAVLGWQGWKLYQQQVAANLQAEFQAAEGAPALLAFAQSHAGTTYGKLAQLEAADALYKDGKFTDAAKAYTDATAIWGTENYGQRARIGLAMSLLQNNDAAGARQQFELLAKDTQSVAYYRSEAAFDLMILEAKAGNSKNVSAWNEQIKTLKDPTWMNEAATFMDMLTAAPESNATTASNQAAPKPLELTNSVTPAKPAAAPAAPAASSKGFDLGPLLNASGSSGTSK